MKKYVLLTVFVLLFWGCKTINYMQKQEKLPQITEASIETGTYVKDEGFLGFFWYMAMTKSPDGGLVSHGYTFSFLNLSLFAIALFAIARIRLKKEENMYSETQNLDVIKAPKNKVISSPIFFRRGMRLLVVLTLLTALIFTYYVVASCHIVIDTVAMSSIIVSTLIYALFVYGYWYFILKYTYIYIKHNKDEDDMILTSRYGAFVYSCISIVILTWFIVIGTLSGLFMPLVGLGVTIIILFMIKKRT